MPGSAPTQAASTWLGSFADALDRDDASAAAALFAEDCYWRDLVAFTWNLKTLEGRADIRAMLEATLSRTRPTGWALDGEASDKDGIIEAWLTFETAVGRGRGYLRLKEGRCWTLLTSLEELKGFEERKGRKRDFGAEHGIHRDRQSWLERREDERRTLGRERQPYCLIVGAGQGGLALGARMRRLDIPTIIVEAHERPGDSWRKRYKSLCLHDPVWYDHMPYLPFPDDWPVYSPKDKIADWLEMYAKVMDINVWTSTTCRSARYDEAGGEWTVEVSRNGETVTLHPKHLVLATGMAGLPNRPDFPGMDSFRGEQHHSSRYLYTCVTYADDGTQK